MGKGSRSVSWPGLVSSCVDTQAKTAPMSSLVAAYWRVEEVVDRPVAGSSFMLWVIITAAEEGMDNHTHTCIHTNTSTQNIECYRWYTQPQDKQ